jgi:hypothetical protein
LKKPDIDLQPIRHNPHAPARRSEAGNPVKTAREIMFVGPEKPPARRR